jgi:hypothetical protein
MQSAEDYKARAPDRGLKMKSRLEFLAEHTEKGGTARYTPTRRSSFIQAARGLVAHRGGPKTSNQVFLDAVLT